MSILVQLWAHAQQTFAAVKPGPGRPGDTTGPEPGSGWPLMAPVLFYHHSPPYWIPATLANPKQNLWFHPSGHDWFRSKQVVLFCPKKLGLLKGFWAIIFRRNRSSAPGHECDLRPGAADLGGGVAGQHADTNRAEKLERTSWVLRTTLPQDFS